MGRNALKFSFVATGVQCYKSLMMEMHALDVYEFQTANSVRQRCLQLSWIRKSQTYNRQLIPWLVLHRRGCQFTYFTCSMGGLPMILMLVVNGLLIYFSHERMGGSFWKSTCQFLSYDLFTNLITGNQPFLHF